MDTKKKKGSSYIDELSSGYESDTVKEYDPAVEEGQMGKAHEEEVAPSNNWGADQRDAIGRAAKKKHLAQKLRRIARELEAMEMSPEYKEDIADIGDQVQSEASGKAVSEELEDEPEDLEKKNDEPEDLEDKQEEEEDQDDEDIVKDAAHPIVHDPETDDPGAFQSAQTGDEEWIDIGPGTFDDARDPVGRAS